LYIAYISTAISTVASLQRDVYDIYYEHKQNIRTAIFRFVDCNTRDTASG